MTKTFEDDLVLEEDKIFEENIRVYGNIRCKDGERFNLTVKGFIARTRGLKPLALAREIQPDKKVKYYE